MKTSFIYLFIALIITISAEYYLFKSWWDYKILKQKNISEDQPLPNLTLFKRAFWDNRKPVDLFPVEILVTLLKLPILYIVILAVAGIIQLRTNSLAGGTICLLIALAGFSRYITNSEKAIPVSTQDDHSSNKNIEGKKATLANRYVPYLLWSIVILLLAFSIYASSSGQRTQDQEFLAPFAWFGSIVLGIIIIFGQGTVSSENNIKKISRQGDFWLLTFVLISGFFLRTFLLTEHPYPLSGDEASIAMEAKHILNWENGNFFATAWSSEPILSFMPNAIGIKLFGDGIGAVRAISVLAGTLAILFTYLVASEMFNATIGLMAASFLAAYPYSLHFSRLTVHNIVDSLMAPLVFWLIAKSVRTENTRLSYLAGMLGGLCFYTYAGTKLVPILGVGILLLFLYKTQQAFSKRVKCFLFFLVGMFISAAPQVISLMKDKGVFLGRMSQEGIFFNGWLAEEVIRRGTPAFEILWSQFTRTFLSFIALPASGMFYNSPKPHLTLLGSIFFLFGMVTAWVKRSKPQYFTLLIWFWAVVIIGGVLTKNPPANTRMLMTTPVTAIFIGIGIYQIIEYFSSRGLLSKASSGLVVLATIGILSFQNIHFYMIEYKNNVYFKDVNSEFAMEVGSMIDNLGPEYQAYIIGEPEVFSEFPTFGYLAPDNQIVNLQNGTESELILAENNKYAFFAIESNHAILEEIITKYKGGQNGIFYRKLPGKTVLFEYYILDGE